MNGLRVEVYNNNVDMALRKLKKKLKDSNLFLELKKRNYYENENFISSLNIPIPGLHNLSNITAAIAASRTIGVDFIEIKKNIKYLMMLLYLLLQEKDLQLNQLKKQKDLNVLN